jgi:beta-lactamase regulating signal transducer with metallopeptidase domain
MEVVLNWLWQGSIVAVALTGLLRLLERARANVRYVVCWAALLLVIALPVLPALAVVMPQPRTLAAISDAPVVSVPTTWWTSTVVIGLAWAVWAGLGAVRLAWAVVALRRARARSRAFPAAVAASLPHWCRLRETGRRPVLVLSDAVTSAAVLGGGVPGGGPPMIAVSPSLVATLEAAEIDRVLIHEWAHVQRRDDFVHVLQVALRIVAGWHPAAWWIERRLHVEREMACDEMTVAITGSPKSYAACLVKLAALRGSERTLLPAPAALGASGLRVRVTRILSHRALIAPVWARGIAAAIVTTLSVVSLAAGAQRLVGVTVLLPFEVVGLPGIDVAATAPAAPPRVTPQARPAQQPPRQPLVAAPPPVPPVDPAPVEAAPVPESLLPSVPPAPVESTEPQVTDEAAADIAAVPPQVPDIPAAPLPIATAESGRSPWAVAADTAADQGVAIGRTSKDAGMATAGFFSRFARRVAGAF